MSKLEMMNMYHVRRGGGCLCFALRFSLCSARSVRSRLLSSSPLPASEPSKPDTPSAGRRQQDLLDRIRFAAVPNGGARKGNRAG